MSFHGSKKRKHSTNETATPVRYTIPPGRQSLIILKTLPDAVCTLHQEGDSTSGYILKLYADHDGIIRFHVSSEHESEVIAKMVLKCEADNKLVEYPLELRSSFKPTHEMPSPPKKNRKTSKKDTSIRPAISEEKMLKISDDELLKRGYPPRPNPEEAPDAFRIWKRIVSIPMTMVKPQVVTNHGISHGGAYHDSSRNWSGYVLRGGGKLNYNMVQGSWHVPPVTGEIKNNAHSSLWVGLDGWGSWVDHTDLVQAGTEQDCVDLIYPINGGEIVHYSFSSYYAWTEFIPQ